MSCVVLINYVLASQMEWRTVNDSNYCPPLNGDGRVKCLLAGSTAECSNTQPCCFHSCEQFARSTSSYSLLRVQELLNVIDLVLLCRFYRIQLQLYSSVSFVSLLNVTFFVDLLINFIFSAYATMSVSVCLSVCDGSALGRGACREHSGCASQRS